MLLILNSFAVFSYKITLAPTLSKYFGFSEEFLSNANIFFVLGFMIGIYLSKLILSYKINFIKKISIAIVISILTVFVDIAVIHWDLNKILFLANRFIEGTASSIAFYIMNYYVDIKLIKNDKKGFIKGLISSKLYAIKFIAPIAGSLVIQYYNPLGSLILPIIAYIMILIIIYNSYKDMLKEYIRYEYKINKSYNNLEKLKRQSKLHLFIKFKNFFSKEEIKSVYIKKKKRKIGFTVRLFLQNIIRPLYDLYFMLIFVNVFMMEITQATFLVSLMIIGQSLSFMTGYLGDWFESKKKYYLYHYLANGYLMIFITLLILSVQGIIEIPYFVYIVLMLLFGLNRNIYNDYYNREIFFYSRTESLNNTRAFFSLFGEFSHALGYLFTSLIFYFYGYIGVVYYIMAITVLILFFMNKKQFIYLNN